MDLHSGLPFWIVKNELNDYYNPLLKDIEVDVAIIGSGITGTLVAHELCKAGIECAIFDKRTLSTGSTAASTAQLQYEIDVPLVKLISKIGETAAVNAYQCCLQSITDIENVLKNSKSEVDFERVSSLYLASSRKDLKLLEKEYECRVKNGIPVSFLNKSQLKTFHNIESYGALKNLEAAQMDSYRAAKNIMQFLQENNALQIFSHTTITHWEKIKIGYELKTEKDFKIKCKYVIIAAGFEAGKFLPKKLVHLNSTYVIISQPVHKQDLWPERSLIWETQEPYIYLRTTSDNRMMIGGGDIPYKDPVKRDQLLREKINYLEKRFKSLFPHIAFEVDMAWCGTFSATQDGLPFIGNYQNKDKMLFALGYGGNGITFSMIAAQILTNKILGKYDSREELFGFNRKKK
ncbi:NAD(P)/FAD-dependent oxidoreductase [Arachidicoccus sp.]|uniref:NAD(P)/FAD-dependent oxidoreductase n=1 Tax=Arachidicoccus sp. TaxID=1872624 RepID=UPI003D1F821D